MKNLPMTPKNERLLKQKTFSRVFRSFVCFFARSFRKRRVVESGTAAATPTAAVAAAAAAAAPAVQTGAICSLSTPEVGMNRGMEGHVPMNLLAKQLRLRCLNLKFEVRTQNSNFELRIGSLNCVFEV